VKTSPNTRVKEAKVKKTEIIEEIEDEEISESDLQDIIRVAQYQLRRTTSMQKFQGKVEARENPSFWSIINPFSSLKQSWKRSKNQIKEQFRDMKDQIKESKKEQMEKTRDYYDSKLNRENRKKK